MEELRCIRATKLTDVACCYSVRSDVFIDGQGIPHDVERDGLDDDCIHFLGRIGRTPIAAARLLPHGDTAKIQRVAVRAHYQKTGAGRKIMEAMIEYARADGFTQVVLGSQVAVVGFYGKLGFVPFGDQYEDASIPHQNMRLAL